MRDLQNELRDAEKRERETRRELEGGINRPRAAIDSLRSESMQLGTRYQVQRSETREKSYSMMRDILNGLVGVFKLGFVSGFLLSAVLALCARF